MEDYICHTHCPESACGGRTLSWPRSALGGSSSRALSRPISPAASLSEISSQIDSRTILDAGGAEKLLGMGDMSLFMPCRRKQARPHPGDLCARRRDQRRVELHQKVTLPLIYSEEMIQEMDKRAYLEKGAGDSGGRGRQPDPMLKQPWRSLSTRDRCPVFCSGAASWPISRAARIMDRDGTAAHHRPVRRLEAAAGAHHPPAVRRSR